MTSLEKFVAIVRAGGLSPAGRREYGVLHVSGALLALSAVGSVFLVTQLGAADVADVVALRVFAYACWLYGAVGLWYLLGPEAMEGQDLPRLRGFAPRPLWTETGTVFTRLSRGMFWAGMPGILFAIFIGDAFATGVRAFGLIVACVLYILSLTLLLALVGGATRRLDARRARWLSALVLAGPFLLSLWLGGVPNVIDGYITAFGWLMTLGGPQ